MPRGDSPACKPIPLADRFWKHVNKTDGCWEWTGALYSNGYGRVTVKHGVHKLAHREAYKLVWGDIPEGMNICHACDNRKCVRPSHIYAGTQQENVNDMLSKGRQRKDVRDALGRFV
jgi:hypothetical protein